MKRTRILLVDDHVIVRKGIFLFLDAEPSVEVVGEVDNGREAVCQAKLLNPDVVLIDLVMPKGGGIQAIAEIRKCLPHIKIVVLTTFNHKEKVKAAMKAGAHGYLLKDADGPALLRAIEMVQNGGMPLHPSVTDTLIEGVTRSSNGNGYQTLTDREEEILKLVGKGMSNRDVAEKLTISEGTVKVHVSRILDKLDVKSRTEATLRAIDIGLISPILKDNYAN
ncbi:MAG: response regulator transcription factor [Anaerolineae bacterium]|nr:response regulator transcription factor [Anaerolineae bacterium]